MASALQWALGLKRKYQQKGQQWVSGLKAVPAKAPGIYQALVAYYANIAPKKRIKIGLGIFLSLLLIGPVNMAYVIGREELVGADLIGYKSAVFAVPEDQVELVYQMAQNLKTKKEERFRESEQKELQQKESHRLKNKDSARMGFDTNIEAKKENPSGEAGEVLQHLSQSAKGNEAMNGVLETPKRQVKGFRFLNGWEMESFVDLLNYAGELKKQELIDAFEEDLKGEREEPTPFMLEPWSQQMKLALTKHNQQRQQWDVKSPLTPIRIWDNRPFHDITHLLRGTHKEVRGEAQWLKDPEVSNMLDAMRWDQHLKSFIGRGVFFWIMGIVAFVIIFALCEILKGLKKSFETSALELLDLGKEDYAKHCILKERKVLEQVALTAQKAKGNGSRTSYTDLADENALCIEEGSTEPELQDAKPISSSRRRL